MTYSRLPVPKRNRNALVAVSVVRVEKPRAEVPKAPKLAAKFLAGTRVANYPFNGDCQR